jgi:MoxR-like ATPase
MWFKRFKADKPQVPLFENGREEPQKGRNYIFNDELVAAIDVALGLGRPLLVSGEPGCGKTELGYAIARRLGLSRVHFFSTKSNAEARDLFYTYDAIGRFRQAQGDSPGDKSAADVADYIEFQALGRAILDAHKPANIRHLLLGKRPYALPEKPSQSVVIIDEIDKASRDFPNDVLREIEDLTFRVPELSQRVAEGKQPEPQGKVLPECRPIVVITSNEERQLPDAFLRRCIFHEIAFPLDETLRAIIASGLQKRFGKDEPGAAADDQGSAGDRTTHELPPEDRDLLIKLLKRFRSEQLEKRPGISEAIDAAALLAYPRDKPKPTFQERLPHIAPALAKLKNDRTKLSQLIGSPVATWDTRTA